LYAAGKSVNDIDGSVVADGSFICFGDSVLYLDEVKITAAGDVKNRKISFKSDVADIDITGAFDVEGLPQSFQNLVGEVLPAVVEIKTIKTEQIFDFSINYKQKNMISGIFLLELEIASQTTAYGSYNSV